MQGIGLLILKTEITSCRIVFVLENGTKLEGNKKIKEHLDFFLDDILEKMKPVFFKTLAETTGWNVSIITVYQDGKFKVDKNTPPDVPFSLDELF